MTKTFDVAIVGGGPGGSTCAAFIKKYRPKMSVAIFERETFPRDHVGESQLPAIGKILHELGAWEKIEAANFPIKIGATYRWGNTKDLWDFHFVPNGEFRNEPRPGHYAGQRMQTALQVDRSVYDQILLDHARSLGVEVFEATGIRAVSKEGDHITTLETDQGDLISAKQFVDASGHVGLLRRNMGVQTTEPTNLKNVAFWDYWTDAHWAVTIGTGGTRVQVMSLGYGWIWFIPISPTRTSVGFICPAEHYKRTGLKPEEIYLQAIKDDRRISGLLSGAEREEKFESTKDWSFVAERLTGENWMLVGESAGFADPILAAGMTLTHASAREAAFTLMEIDRGGDAKWLKSEYESRNHRRIMQHIRFADYWYTANAHFSDLKEFTRTLAKDAGLELSADKAFQWLGTGGFVDDDLGGASFAAYSISSLHQIGSRLSAEAPTTAFGGYNGFVLNLDGAKKVDLAHYENGRVTGVPGYERNGRILPLHGLRAWMVEGLKASPRFADSMGYIEHSFQVRGAAFSQAVIDGLLESLESLIRDGWVECKTYKGDVLPDRVEGANVNFQVNRDLELPQSQRSPHLEN